MLKKLAKILLLSIAAVVLAYAAWNYFAGPLKDRRDIRQLGAAIADCTRFSQTARKAADGSRLTNDVDGPTDAGLCKFSLQTAGRQKIYCAIPLAETAAVGSAYADFAENIGLFGSVTISYDSSKPDLWNDTMNSTMCKIE